MKKIEEEKYNFIQIRKEDIFISFNVKTNRKFDEIHINQEELVVFIKTQPRKGKANKSILKMFSEILKIPINSIEIVSGLKSVDKIIKIYGIKNVDKKFILKKLIK